jgi:hypothetical protein
MINLTRSQRQTLLVVEVIKDLYKFLIYRHQNDSCLAMSNTLRPPGAQAEFALTKQKNQTINSMKN